MKWARDIAGGALVALLVFAVAFFLLQQGEPSGAEAPTERKAQDAKVATPAPARDVVAADQEWPDPVMVREPPLDPVPLPPAARDGAALMGLDEFAAKVVGSSPSSRDRARIMEAYLQQLPAARAFGWRNVPYMTPQKIIDWLGDASSNRRRALTLHFYPLQFPERPIPEEYILSLDTVKAFMDQGNGSGLSPRGRAQALEFYTAQLRPNPK